MNELKRGDQAPAFSAMDQEGRLHQLKDYKGKKLVLYFYPKDKTPGCTAEACNLSANYDSLTERNIVVLGVSADDEKSHKSFAEKFRLPFPLLADVKKEIIHAYGVWGEKKFLGKRYMGILRTTFLINENGIIEHIISKVKTKDHSAQIFEFWK